MSSWRVGQKLGRTLYLDDKCIGMVDTPEMAAEIVAAMNRRTPALPADQRPAREVVHTALAYAYETYGPPVKRDDCGPYCDVLTAMLEEDRAARPPWPVPPGWNGEWGNGLAEAIRRLRIHAGPREEVAAPPPRFDARDRLALGYVLEVVARPPRDVQGEGGQHNWKPQPGVGWRCGRCKCLRRIVGAGEPLMPTFAHRAPGTRQWMPEEPACAPAAAPLPEKEPPR